MKTMKKLGLIFVLVLALAVCLCSCGKEETPYDYDLNEYVTLGSFPEVKVDEEEVKNAVDEAVETITSEYKEVKDVTDRTSVQDGDTANIDYVGKIDGKEFEGGSAKGTELKIGSNKFIAGFEKGLIGHNVGQTVDLNLVFPEDYDNKDVAGKPVVFTVTINSLREDIIPELTDEMVKEKTEFDTVDEYLEDTRKTQVESALWTTFLESCKVTKYPETETKQRYDTVVDSYSQMALYNGMTLEQMVTSFYGYQSIEEFLQYAMDSAKSAVKEEMVIWLAVRENDISLTDAEYDKEVAVLAKEADYDKVKDYEDAVGKDSIKLSIYVDKLTAIAYEKCDISFDEADDKAEDKTEDTTSGENKEEKPEDTTAAETTGAETSEADA